MKVHTVNIVNIAPLAGPFSVKLHTSRKSVSSSIWFPLKGGFSNILFHSCGLPLSVVLSAPIIGSSWRHEPMMHEWEETGDGTASILYLAVCDISSILHSEANGPSAVSNNGNSNREEILGLKSGQKEKAFKNCRHRYQLPHSILPKWHRTPWILGGGTPFQQLTTATGRAVLGMAGLACFIFMWLWKSGHLVLGGGELIVWCIQDSEDAR